MGIFQVENRNEDINFVQNQGLDVDDDNEPPFRIFCKNMSQSHTYSMANAGVLKEVITGLNQLPLISPHRFPR